MKLWKLTQDVNNHYDTYDSCVVAAETEEAAKAIHPGTPYDTRASWASPSDINVELIGEGIPGTEEGVICASFNAG